MTEEDQEERIISIYFSHPTFASDAFNTADNIIGLSNSELDPNILDIKLNITGIAAGSAWNGHFFTKYEGNPVIFDFCAFDSFCDEHEPVNVESGNFDLSTFYFEQGSVVQYTCGEYSRFQNSKNSTYESIEFKCHSNLGSIQNGIITLDECVCKLAFCLFVNWR